MTVARAIEMLEWFARARENQRELTGSAHPWPALSPLYEQHLEDALAVALECLEWEEARQRREETRQRARVTEVAPPALPAARNGKRG